MRLRRSEEDQALDTRAERTRKRFVRRQWRRRFGLWKPILAAVVVLALVATGVWLAYFSKYLAVGDVTVVGASFVKEEQVLKAARVENGRPLARVDLDAARRRIEALAPVASATVAREWPRTIAIDITERTAVAVVDLGGQVRGLDESGVLFRDYPRRPPALPLVRIPGEVDNTVLAEAAQVVRALPFALSRRVDHLSVETIDQISLVLRDGRIVLWGSAEESAAKAQVLGKLLAQEAKVYDVSVPGQPTTRTTVPPGLG